VKCIQVKEPGGPEKISIVEVDTPAPGPGQALVRVVASGVNFLDVYLREGAYYKIDLPLTLGNEAAGTVEAVGPGVTEVAVGDRVAYAMVRGSYAEYALVPAARLVTIPDSVGFVEAAAAMLQGMTAHYLTHSTYKLGPGDTCLVHAAAGGAGGLLVQVAKMRGARVLGTVSTEEKAHVARECGADDTILYTTERFDEAVTRLTGGRGVDVVYDSVGRDTFEMSLNCLRPRGMLVLFGQSSGPVPPVDTGTLNGKGSLFLTRTGLGHHLLTREELLWRARDVLDWVATGRITLRIGGTYPLSEAARAHRDLESRRTTGKLILTVDVEHA
jgi:NADPH2:quinone reductase